MIPVKSFIAFLSLLLSLSLGLTALAVTEGQVQAAPDIDIWGLATNSPASGDYLPDASIFSPVSSFSRTPDPTPSPKPWTGYGEGAELSGDLTTPEPTPTPAPVASPDPALERVDYWQLPRLTATEARRARQLISAYELGEMSGDGQSIIGVTENVEMGVYPLNPDDYDGERVYVLLPVTILSDEQLLSLIDAFHRLGLSFEPDALNYRNCMRGGFPESNRTLTQEENARQQIIIEKIQRGAILSSDISPSADARQYLLSLNRDAFLGLAFFRILPYRSLTDDELAALCFASGYTCIEDMGIYENMGFMLAHAVGAPLSMEYESTRVDRYLPVQADENGNLVLGEAISAVFFTGRSVLGQGRVRYYTSAFDRASGEAIEFGWHLGSSAYRALDQEPQALLSAEECLQIACQECEALFSTMQKIHHSATEGIRGLIFSEDALSSRPDALPDDQALLFLAGLSFGDEESRVFRCALHDGWWLDVGVSTCDGTVTSLSVTKYPFPYSAS